MKCDIKSKIRGVWEPATISMDHQNIAFIITRKQSRKLLSFHALSIGSVVRQQNEEFVNIQLDKRTYEIRAAPNKLSKLMDIYKLWQYFQNYKEVPQQKLQKPKVINYHAKMNAILSQQKELRSKEEMIIAENTKKQLEKRQAQLQETRVAKKQAEKQVIEYQSFYKTADWKRDTELGGLLFINEEKKSQQPKIIKFLISKFISTGSFMGISFPVFAMKPQSILETYCRCLSLAPRLLTGLKNPIDRLKAVNAVILSLSLRFIDIDKSFNPTIGQTFQTFVQGYEITAEQVSHHPPISALLLYGQDFRLHACLEVQASMGFNAAKGRFYGDIVVEYSDGGKIIGKMPCGTLFGYLFGRYVFYPDGANYVFDPVNQLLCSYEVTQQDVYQGYIGKPNYKSWNEFYQLMNATDEDERNRKYEAYQHIKSTNCEKIYSKVKAKWTKEIVYDRQMYLDFEDSSQAPPKLSKKLPKHLLPSDSRFRKDIALRVQQKMQESQQQKQEIQQQQRRVRKLRQSNHKPQ